MYPFWFNSIAINPLPMEPTGDVSEYAFLSALITTVKKQGQEIESLKQHVSALEAKNVNINRLQFTTKDGKISL